MAVAPSRLLGRLTSAPGRALVPVLALALVLASVVPAEAQSAGGSSKSSSTAARKERRSQIQERIRTLRDQVEEASEEEAGLLDRLDAAAQNRRSLDARVAAVEADLAGEQRRLDAAAARLERANADLVGARGRLDAARAQVRAAHDDLRRRAVAAYVHNPATEALNVLLQVRSLRSLHTTNVYVRTTLDAQQRVVAHHRALEVDATDLKRAVEDQVEVARVLHREFLDRTRELAVAREAADVVRDEALAHERAEAALLAEVRSRKSEFEAEIDALQAESRSITALLRSRQTGLVPSPQKGLLDPPIPYAVVTSRFGPRVHPVYRTSRMHNGIDLRAGPGTPIRAAGDGVVLFAGPRGGYGNTVVIDHGQSLATLYAHQQTIYVSEGARVTLGQVIGAVGSTGLSTGPHLHFEVRAAGIPVDPLAYL